jgi:hypothetical protein
LLRGTVFVVLGALVVGALVVGALVVGVLVVGVAVKATTLLDVGARRSPSPTLGVGKWFAGTPIETCWRTVPVEGSSPYSVPSCPMVHTRPAATIGGPPPTREVHSTVSEAGDAVTATATVPLGHGR